MYRNKIETMKLVHRSKFPTTALLTEKREQYETDLTKRIEQIEHLKEMNINRLSD